jgi:hypothetical protein
MLTGWDFYANKINFVLPTPRNSSSFCSSQQNTNVNIEKLATDAGLTQQ